MPMITIKSDLDRQLEQQAPKWLLGPRRCGARVEWALEKWLRLIAKHPVDTEVDDDGPKPRRKRQRR